MSRDAYNSYFTLFQLPQHLNLDTLALEKQFYALSRRLHPDRLAAKPASAQEAALEGLWSAWDAGVDAGDEAAKARAREAMVELLNKRSYLWNLVRDVNETLGL